MNFPRPSDASDTGQSEVDAGAVTRAIRRGDEAAFERFYERYCDRLLRLLLALTRGDDGTSREVLQTVMIKLARKLPVIDSEVELWSWLARVARNALVDHWRRAGRVEAAAPLELDSALEVVADSATNEDALLGCLDAAIETLSADHRWLVREFYFERRSHQELAKALGKTPKAIESKLARIRQALRVALKQQDEP